MALSSSIGQATSNTSDQNYVTVASYSGKGMLTAIYLDYSSGSSSGSPNGSTNIGTLRITIDGTSTYLDVGTATVSGGTITGVTWGKIVDGLVSIKLPFSTSLSVAVASGKLTVDATYRYIKLTATAIYVKEV